MTLDLDTLERITSRFHHRSRGIEIRGYVTEASSGALAVSGLASFATLGEHVEIATSRGPVRAEVALLRGERVVAIPLGNADAVRLGDVARIAGRPTLSPHASWRGRTIGALGEPIDGGSPLQQGARALAIDRVSPPALMRQRVDRALCTGVRAIDVFLPICTGQRIGIFAGSGVGKSTLLAMLANLSATQRKVLDCDQ